MARKHSDRHAALPEAVEPMLATPDGGELRDDPRYVYEWKWDGYRAVMRLASDGTVALTSRNGNDFTARYPELSGPMGDAFGGKPVVLDGEIVALNEQGRPDFGLLQNRRKAGRSVSYFAFDVLRVGEESFLDEPYSRRREVLTAIDPSDEKVITVPPAYSRSRLAASDLTPAGLLDIAAESGLEGLVYKAANSRYRPGHRSPDWLKHPLIQTREVVIGGCRPGKDAGAAPSGRCCSELTTRTPATCVISVTSAPASARTPCVICSHSSPPSNGARVPSPTKSRVIALETHAG